MRILILITEREFRVSARIQARIGETLAERGHLVTLVCVSKSQTEAELAKRFPSLKCRSIAGRGVRQFWAFRRIVKGVHPAVVLVQGEKNMMAAAIATGRKGGVVRRLSVGESVKPTWRATVASSRSRCVVLGDDLSAPDESKSPMKTALGWDAASVNRAPTGRVANRARSEAGPVLGIVSGNPRAGAQKLSSKPFMEYSAAALALRAASRLATRYPELRVLLLGQSAALQAVRVHAASVGMASRITIEPIDSLIASDGFHATLVWVAAQSDEGAVSIISAMMRGIPVIVPANFDTQAFVAPQINGFVAVEADISTCVSAVANVLANPEQLAAMGAAAESRARRLHDWDFYVNRIMGAISKVTDYHVDSEQSPRSLMAKSRRKRRK